MAFFELEQSISYVEEIWVGLTSLLVLSTPEEAHPAEGLVFQHSIHRISYLLRSQAEIKNQKTKVKNVKIHTNYSCWIV